MHVKLAVLADHASISREGKLNIMGIFDEINARELPVALPIFYVVVSYGTQASEFETTKDIQMALQDEDGTVLVRLEQPNVTIPRPQRPGMRGTVNLVHGIAGLPFSKAGDYEFSILINGQPEGSISLRVNAVTEG